MMNEKLKWHAIAGLFPMLGDDEIQLLADDIREHGLNEPITLYEGQVLDGRNRSAACLLAGVEPTYVTFDGTRLEAVAHVWSRNRCRRHLDSSQCAIAEARRLQICEEYADEVKRLAAEAASRVGGDRKSETAKTESKSCGNEFPHDRESGRVTEQRAKAAGTNRRYVEIADKLEAERPDLADKVLAGEMTIPQAKREMDSPSPGVTMQGDALPPENSRRRQGVIHGNEAVIALKRISANDELRIDGFRIAADFIRAYCPAALAPDEPARTFTSDNAKVELIAGIATQLSLLAIRARSLNKRQREGLHKLRISHDRVKLPACLPSEMQDGLMAILRHCLEAVRALAPVDAEVAQ